MDAVNYIRGLRGNQIYPQNLVLPYMPVEGGKVWFVDGDQSTGSHGGRSWSDAFDETEFDGALSSLGDVRAGDVIYVAARTMAQTDTDPISYTTNLTVDVPQVSIIGVSRGLTQGGLPQLKVGATTTQAVIRVRAPGVMIANIGINGAGATGGGIRFDDDGGTTYASFGGSVLGCHFKNCVGTTATNAATGGAIMLSGAPWQIRIDGNVFYKNVGDVVLLDTSNAVPQDVVIQNNIFSPVAASTDCNIYGAGGSGFGYVIIDSNVFGQLPAVGSGSIKRYMDLTGADGGMVTRNVFGALAADTGTTLTWLAAGTAAKIPTTVHVAGNYGQSDTATESGEVTIGANS